MAPEIAYTTLTPTNKGTTPGEMQNVDVLDNNNVDNKSKGKAIQLGSFSDDEQLEGSDNDGYDTTNNDEASPGSSPLSDSLLDPDSLVYEDDSDHYGYEMYEEDEGEEADDYVSEYQALFDAKEKELPSGVEVTMDWLPNSETSGTSKSSTKKSKKGSGIHSQHSDKPWSAQPHNSKGEIIPNSAYPFPKKHLHSQAPVPAPAPAPASSSELLPTQYTPQGFKKPIVDEVISGPTTFTVKRKMEDYLGKYVFFKRFDIVEDLVDHHYGSKGSASKKHSKEWAKRIQEEWKILENDLPEMIFVRAYESRMDLLRAVIIGADGTPYHDGLFFFDIFFPDTYPSVPPLVHYQSGGLRINPNLYHSGKVCLSLLGTWSGSSKEKWLPNTSTMLQVLVSIQGLILNQKPFFNEPGFARLAGSASGEKQSNAYSENTFLLSLKTMVYNMRRPKKYFEDFTYGHFFSCAHDVLKACNAYRNGAPVASLVRGKVKEGEESSERCSEKFRTDVATFVDTLLLKEFILLGVLGLEPEEEDKPSETNVAESSKSNKPKKRRVSSN